MTHIRCQGCMAKDHFIDLLESVECPGMEDWQYCLHCGNVLDPLMEQNRLARQEKVLAFPSGEPDYQDDEVHLGAESIVRRAA
jgi:hypothetical protein